MKVPGFIKKISLFILVFLLLPLTIVSTEVFGSESNRIEIYIYGPVLAHIVDREGRRSGRDLDTGQILKDVPGSRIVMEKTRDRMPGWTIHVSDPVPGIYRIQVKGTGPGGFIIDVDAIDSSGQVKNSNIFKRIQEGNMMEFFFTYTSDNPEVNNPLIMSPN